MSVRELAMEQHLSNLSVRSQDVDGQVTVGANVWLLSAEDVPPILFAPEAVGRLLGIGRAKVYDLMRRNELRSVKVGCSRRVSAQALRDYVEVLELREPA